MSRVNVQFIEEPVIFVAIMMAYFCFKKIDDNCHFIDANCRKIQSFAASNVGEALTRVLRRLVHLLEYESIQCQHLSILGGGPIL